MKRILVILVFVSICSLGFSGGYINIKKSLTPFNYIYGEYGATNYHQNTPSFYRLSYSTFKDSRVHLNMEFQVSVFTMNNYKSYDYNPDVLIPTFASSMGFGAGAGVGVGYHIIQNARGFNLSGNTGAFVELSFDDLGLIYYIPSFGLKTQLIPTFRFTEKLGLGLFIEAQYYMTLALLFGGSIPHDTGYMINAGISMAIF